MKNAQFLSLDLTWKYLRVVPAIAVLFTLNPVKAQTPDNLQDIEQYLDLAPDQNIYLVIRASLQKKSLENIADQFRRRGVNINYQNVEYNSEHLLTRISIEATIGRCESENGDCFRWQEEAYNNGLPLDKDRPLIFYIYRVGGKVEAAGTSYGYPEDLPRQEIQAMKNLTGSIIGILRAD